MSEDFETRGYEPGDEAAILRLFHRVFHAGRTLEHWRWKYAESPFGNRRISLTFAADGELVAHYAGYPVPFRENGEGGSVALTGLQIGDTMTAPGFRHVGRGPTSLLGRTVQHFYANFCDGKVAFNFGFNTANIQKFSLRFVKARRIEDVGSWVLENPSSRLRELLPFSRYEVSPVEAVDVEWDELFERLAPRFPLLVARTASWVDWRYLRCPDPGFRLLAARRGRRLVGWIVVRPQADELIWGDALVDPDHPGALRPLLRTALATHPRATRITAWFADRSTDEGRPVDGAVRWTGQLRDLGFSRRPEPNALAVMAVPFLRGEATEALLAHAYWAQGDGDLY